MRPFLTFLAKPRLNPIEMLAIAMAVLSFMSSAIAWALMGFAALAFDIALLTILERRA